MIDPFLPVVPVSFAEEEIASAKSLMRRFRLGKVVQTAEQRLNETLILAICEANAEALQLKPKRLRFIQPPHLNCHCQPWLVFTE